MVKSFKFIPLKFFLNNNVQQIAQDLLGKIIYTNINGIITSAIIIETEAYQGPEDKASHAYNNKRTKRTEIMYKSGGCCYIYICYGIHYLFNIITNKKNIPHAVLIRTGKVHSGLQHIKKRRGNNISTSKLLQGPGNFSKGLGINIALNGIYLNCIMSEANCKSASLNLKSFLALEFLMILMMQFLRKKLLLILVILINIKKDKL